MIDTKHNGVNVDIKEKIETVVVTQYIQMDQLGLKFKTMPFVSS